MTPLELINKYYNDNEQLRELLLRHSTDVANKALEIANNHPELAIDTDFVYEAAILHDIGVFLTDAPAIHCFGKERYIRHGILGAELLRREGFPLHARVAERHTGAGITAEDIRQQQLPLPAVDMLPETIEEKLICYADKFFSKSRPETEKTLEAASRSLQKFGGETQARFESLITLFG